MTTNFFFFISDEFLIEAVKLKPELYDLSSPYYSDTVAKRRIWTEIGQQMSCEGKGFDIMFIFYHFAKELTQLGS